MSDEINDNSELEDISPEELARAEAFGAKTDALLESLRIAPVEDAEDRELLELAGVIRASHKDSPLAADRERSIIDEAFKEALGLDDDEVAPVSELEEMRKRRGARLVPIATLVLAAAAALLLFLRQGPDKGDEGVATVVPVERNIPAEQRSRASDAEIGQIPSSQAGAAGARLDRIYDHRLRGYRQLRLDRQVGQK